MVSVAYNQADPSYRREPGENQSHLKHILKSPAHYQASKQRRFSSSVFMDIGSALHCKVLEGDDEFMRRFTLKPNDISLATKEGKEWKATNKNKTILTNSDKDMAWDSVHGMTESLRKLDWFKWDQSEYRKFNELSIYWEADGVDCKARLDRLIVEDDRCLVLDLKTTDSIDPEVFGKKVSGGMNYVFQAAWYAEAASLAFKKPTEFIFVAIERQMPWSVGIFQVSESMMEEGKAQITEARRRLRECRQTKVWPAPEITFNTLELPRWYSSPLADITQDFVPLF